MLYAKRMQQVLMTYNKRHAFSALQVDDGYT